jgi:hypothetical protein
MHGQNVLRINVLTLVIKVTSLLLTLASPPAPLNPGSEAVFDHPTIRYGSLARMFVSLLGARRGEADGAYRVRGNDLRRELQ